MFACLHAPGNLPLLLACAQQFSPRVELTSADTVILDLAGLEVLWGTNEEIAIRILSHLGIPARLAIASSPDTARLLALGYEEPKIIPVGQEAAALSSLSVRLLPCSSEAAAALHSWGIHTLGQLASLPPLGIAARLGEEEGVLLQRLATGQECRLLRIPEIPLQFAATQELEYAVDLLEPLLFVLSRLLQDLCQRLRSVSLATNAILLHLHLESGALQECQIPLPVPLVDPKTLLKLLQLHLMEHSPSSPVIKVSLVLHPVPPLQEQQGLFLPSSPEPQKMEIVLARLRKLLGAEHIGTAVPQNTHRPDHFRVERFTPVQQATCLRARSIMPLRRFRPCRRAQVRVERKRPVYITSVGVAGCISHCAGPWHTSGDWWKGEAWDRAEWDIALPNGTLYRIHQDLQNGLWLVEGSYD